MERIIFHVDMDSYFASVEQQANPQLRGRPVVVTGKPTIKTVVAAASKEAKKFGIKSAMATWEARKLCPDLVLVPGDPDKYQWATEQFLFILRDYSPRLEVFGIDEAFLDVTEAATDGGESLEIAEKVQERISEELGNHVTCSVGIAKNKLLAKLASDMDKPEGTTLIAEEDVPRVLSSTPMTEMCGIGPRIKRRLNRLGIYDLIDLGKASESTLKNEFGVLGGRLKLMGQGKDPSPVTPAWQGEEVKSIGNSLTLPPYKRTIDKSLPVLFKLSQQVGYRLRSRDLMGKTVKLTVRDERYEVGGKQLTVGQYTDDGNRIYSGCQKIAASMRFPSTPTMVGVRVSNLKSRGSVPEDLFSENRARSRLLNLMDSINDEHGEETVYLAAQSGTEDLMPSTGAFRRPCGLLHGDRSRSN